MGTHAYILNIWNSDKKKEIITKVFDTKYVIDFESIEKENLFYKSTTCRESLTTTLNDFTSFLFNEDTYEKGEYTFGIKCLGQMHSNVSRILLKNKSNIKKFSQAINGIFHTEFEITCQEKEIVPFVKQKRASEDFYGTINIFIKSKRDYRFPCLISALIAILREERIVKGILNDSINSTESLVKELIRISSDRLLGKDNTYFCLFLIDNIYNNKSQALNQIKKSLSTEKNTDGSDWYSIFMLSIFVYFYSKKYREIDDYYSDYGGPVDFVENVSDVDERGFLFPFVKMLSKLDEFKIVSTVYSKKYYKDDNPAEIYFLKEAIDG